jgi:hypothetical protein
LKSEDVTMNPPFVLRGPQWLPANPPAGGRNAEADGLRSALAVAQVALVAWCAARVVVDLRSQTLGFEGILAVALGAAVLVWTLTGLFGRARTSAHTPRSPRWPS